MKKIFIIVLILLANISFAQYGIDENAIYLDINKNIGIGIKTPTSRLHVFGNGTTSNLFNLTNDKDATKDSSVVVDKLGRLCAGTNTPYNGLVKNTFMIRDFSQGENTVWIDSTTTDSNLIHVNKIISMNSNAQGVFGVGGATYNTNTDFRNSFFITSVDGSLHLANEYYTKATLGSWGLGVGTIIPQAGLDVRNRWGAPHLLRAGSDLDGTLDSSMVVMDDGKVGIGEATPTAKLHINGNKITPNNLLYVTNDADATKDSTVVIKSNGYVGIGNNTSNFPLQVWGSANSGANIYSEYSGSSLASAIKGYASGGAGYGIVGTASTIGTTGAGGFFQNTAGGLALDLRADNGIAIRVRSGDVIVNGIRFHSITTTLPDNSTYGLPTGYSWIGEIDVDSLGYTLFTAQIRCDANGTPYLEGVSWKRWSSKTYVEVGSTDGYLNITDGGSGMAITNSLGYTIEATLRFRTKP